MAIKKRKMGIMREFVFRLSPVVCEADDLQLVGTGEGVQTMWTTSSER